MYKYDDWANRKGHSGQHRKEVIESCMTFELEGNVSVYFAKFPWLRKRGNINLADHPLTLMSCELQLNETSDDKNKT